MLPRLKAEEALHQADVVAVGTGRMKPQAANRLVAGWQRLADAGTAQTVKVTPQQLGSMGIGLHMVHKSNG